MPLLHLYHYERLNASYCTAEASDATLSSAFPEDGHLRVATRTGPIRSEDMSMGVIVTTANRSQATFAPRYPHADWILVLDHIHNKDGFRLVTVTNDPGRKAIYYLYEHTIVA